MVGMILFGSKFCHYVYEPTPDSLKSSSIVLILLLQMGLGWIQYRQLLEVAEELLTSCSGVSGFPLKNYEAKMLIEMIEVLKSVFNLE